MVVVVLLAVAVSFLFYFNHEAVPNTSFNLGNLNQNDNGLKIVDSINIQNNALANYFNSLYNSQLSDIESKYNNGSISSSERDKQLNAVIKNHELTIEILNKLSNAKMDIFTGNITKQDILLRISSFKNIDFDIKSQLNDTLNG